MPIAPPTNGECYANLSANPDRGIYIYDNVNTLNIRVVDPMGQGSSDFVLSDESYTVTGDEEGINCMPDQGRSPNRLGTGAWIHFKLGTPVRLQPDKSYGVDVTVSHGNNGFFLKPPAPEKIATRADRPIAQGYKTAPIA